MKIVINYGEYDEYFKKHWFTYDYFKIKDFLLENNINNSYPDMLDRISQESIICLVNDIVLETVFDDDELKITILQMYRLAKETTSYGNIPTLAMVPEEEHDDVVRMIDGLALNRVTEIY